MLGVAVTDQSYFSWPIDSLAAKKNHIFYSVIGTLRIFALFSD